MSDRDCKHCKHLKPDGCSRWDCEYEPVMSDLIKKSDAIKALYKYNFVSKNVIEREINAIPSADRPAGWIPVSERLPDIGDTYLVTVMVGKEIRTDVADSFGSYIDGFWDTFHDWVEDEECHVIAWMPLPEPYKGGDTE